MIRAHGIALALLAASGCGMPRDVDAGAPDEPPRAAEFRSPRLDATLESAARVVRTRGFAAEGPVWRAFLVEQGSDVRSIGMRTGSCYVVLAVGSSAMRELDLRVFDADGAEVARETEQGPVAALRFCPAQSGTYYAASRSAAGSGLYAASAFRGPTGLAFRVEDVLRAIAPAAPSERDPG